MLKEPNLTSAIDVDDDQKSKEQERAKNLERYLRLSKIAYYSLKGLQSVIEIVKSVS